MFPQPVFAPIGRVSGPLASNEPQNNDVFLFDLETLTDRDQGHVDHGFALYLEDFAKQRPCYLVSRQNYNEVMLRVPSTLRKLLAGVFSSAGSELWVRNEVLIRHEHDFSDDLFEFVAKVVQKSAYPQKRAPMIDCGPASLSICIAGYASTSRQIATYLDWEAENAELPVIADEFRARFSQYDICQDTEHSLLVTPNSFNSAVVRDHILRRHKSARLISYMTTRSAEGFAKPLFAAHARTDICSIVGGASDVSQLLSYEKRNMAGKDFKISLNSRLPEEA